MDAHNGTYTARDGVLNWVSNDWAAAQRINRSGFLRGLAALCGCHKADLWLDGRVYATVTLSRFSQMSRSSASLNSRPVT
jgi:hypothetical protein